MHLKHRSLAVITIMVSILLILAVCCSGAAASSQTSVKLTVYEVTIHVDQAVAKLGYEVYSDEEPREVHHDRTYQSLVVSQYDSHGVELGASEQVLVTYVPEGWKLHAYTSAGTVTVEENRVMVEDIKENITLYITAEIPDFIVTAYCLVQFETFTEEVIEDQYLKEGSLVREPVQPAETGWVFAGWYTEEGNQWNFAQDRVYYSMTLYAKWEPAEDRPPVTPDEPVTPVETPLGVAGVLAGMIGAGAVMLKRRGKI